MRKSILVGLVILASASPLACADGGDVLLSIPQIGKIGVSLFMDASLLSNNPTDPTALLTAGSVTLLLGVPSAFLLLNVINDNPEGVRAWRTISFFSDIAVALLAIAAGVYTIAADAIQPTGGEDWAPVIGAALISISIPMGATAWAETVPFPMEKAH